MKSRFSIWSNVFFQIIGLLILSAVATLAQSVPLVVDGSMEIGSSNSPNPNPGTIRFNGQNFEGWNGLTWVSLGKFKLMGTVTDIDGNEYQTVGIGNDEWMAENLRVTHYHDGSTMQIHLGSNVINFGSPGSLYYPNDMTSNASDYGALYDYFCIETGKLCPTGWHVPDSTEWFAMVEALGGSAIAGARMKEPGGIYWLEPNVGACNDSGFTARGAGQRSVATGTIIDFKERGLWWVDTLIGGTDPVFCFVEDHDVDILFTTNSSKEAAYSIRCVKDK